MTTSIWSSRIFLIKFMPPKWVKKFWTNDCSNTGFSKLFGLFHFLVQTKRFYSKAFPLRVLQLKNYLTKTTVISTCCLTKLNLKKKLCESSPHCFLSSECSLSWRGRKIYCLFQMPCRVWSTHLSWQFTFLTWPMMGKKKMWIVWIKFRSHSVTWSAF